MLLCHVVDSFIQRRLNTRRASIPYIKLSEIANVGLILLTVCVFYYFLIALVNSEYIYMSVCVDQYNIKKNVA